MDKPEDSISLGKKIKQLRTQKGWSLDELSKRSGIAKTTLWSIENGSKTSYDKLGDIAVALGIQLAELSLYDRFESMIEKFSKKEIVSTNTSEVFNSYFKQVKNPKKFILKNSFSVDVDSLTDTQIDELFIFIDFAIKLKLEEFRNSEDKK
ncbi:helix-turn-helix domain-containing protein [Clostridium neonatale]|uniref:helix-turn-helix domain-containing protein n=1 Tax=Clostridium neonatale TaxID=137838 RepID=UPI00291BB427|nr:putative Helix-turn-helix domain protein [Clostridium neonatale]